MRPTSYPPWRIPRLGPACVALTLLSTPAALGQTAAPALAFQPPGYQVRLQPSVRVPMRDGIGLSTDLYFPEGQDSLLPVILIRTSQGKDRWRPEGSRAWLFAGQGYAVAVQDVRGTHESEGSFTSFGTEADDGYDAVSWAATQPWSNGKVGTFGCADEAANQVATARLGNVFHAAMIAEAAGGAVGSAGRLYAYSGTYQGGVFELAAGFGRFYRRGTGPVPGSGIDLPAILSTLPVIGMMSAAAGRPTEFEELLSHPPADPWWDRFGYVKDADRFGTPALHLGSWTDRNLSGTLLLFELMRRNATNPDTRDNQYLVISPATRCGAGPATDPTHLGQRDPAAPPPGFDDLYLRWFDRWLRGYQDRMAGVPKVQLFVMGKNLWRAEQEWPLARTSYQRYYLHSLGGANSRQGDGTLSPKKPGKEPYDRFVYDPSHPVPSSRPTGGEAEGPAADQAPVELRRDILVYSTPPLKKGVEVTGPIQLVLYVSSGAWDTDFTAKLVDVYPDGSAYAIQEGIQRARYREGYDRKVWMEPGGVYLLHVELHATSNYFGPGHRIRLEVSSSNFPRFERNLNTGGNNFDESHAVVTSNIVHHSARAASYLTLPVIPE